MQVFFKIVQSTVLVGLMGLLMNGCYLAAIAAQSNERHETRQTKPENGKCPTKEEMAKRWIKDSYSLDHTRVISVDKGPKEIWNGDTLFNCEYEVTYEIESGYGMG